MIPTTDATKVWPALAYHRAGQKLQFPRRWTPRLDTKKVENDFVVHADQCDERHRDPDDRR
jgi:hypothetical protein